MSPVTHHEVLGVEPDASPEEVRRAYLRLARRHHPDRHAAAVDQLTAGDDSGQRMRDVNAAWSVLGDVDLRAEYDRRILDPPAAERPGRRGGRTKTAARPVETPSSEFRPYHDDDEDDDDSWRYEPDPYDPDTALGKLLSVGPPLLLLAGFGLMAVSLVLSQTWAVALAISCILLALLLFVAAPLIAATRSQSVERQRSARATDVGRSRSRDAGDGR